MSCLFSSLIPSHTSTTCISLIPEPSTTKTRTHNDAATAILITDTEILATMSQAHSIVFFKEIKEKDQEYCQLDHESTSSDSICEPIVKGHWQFRSTVVLLVRISISISYPKKHSTGETKIYKIRGRHSTVYPVQLPSWSSPNVF